MKRIHTAPASRASGPDPSRQRVTASFELFKGNPTSTGALDHLREALAQMEQIADQNARVKCARDLTAELLGSVWHLPNGDGTTVASAVGLELDRSTTTRLVLAQMVRAQHAASEARGSTVSAGTAPEVTEKQTNPNNGGEGTGRFILDLKRMLGGLQPNAKVVLHDNGDITIARGGGIDSCVPWWAKRKNQFWMVVTALVALACGIPTIGWLTKDPERVVVERRVRVEVPVPVQQDADAVPFRYAGYITPEVESIVAAASNAIQPRHFGPLNLQQIFDIYDFATRTISYSNVSHPQIPRMPALTLETRNGDCKSMAVLLASMLESKGAETIIIDWFIPPPIDTGHAYTGVLVAISSDDAEIEQARQTVLTRIRERYSRRRYRESEIDFREITVNGVTELYLLLDVTQGLRSVPGVTNDRPELEVIENSCPNTPNNIPILSQVP